jgi:hypothetical protein
MQRCRRGGAWGFGTVLLCPVVTRDVGRLVDGKGVCGWCMWVCGDIELSGRGAPYYREAIPAE